MERGQTRKVVVDVVVTLLLFWSFSLAAQTLPASGAPQTLTLQILLSPSAGAPTAQQVVNGFASGSTTLQGMSGVNKPQSVTYLLQTRAAGDFLTS